jgi:hypothetical protein
MAAPQEPGLEKPVLSAEASVLAPAVKVPEHANGYLLTLRETVRGDARDDVVLSLPWGSRCVLARPPLRARLNRVALGRGAERVVEGEHDAGGA